MSQEDLKQGLREFYESETLQCASIKGRWGTGKTFVLENFLKGKPYIYQSLFGIESINQLRKSLMTNTYLGDSEIASKGVEIFKAWVNSKLDTNIDSVLTPTTKLISKLLSGIDVIVLDDLERASIKIVDLLGFVEQIKQNSNIKVLLVLNEGKLEESEQSWLTYREKILDKEFHLDVSHDEAISILAEKVGVKIPDQFSMLSKSLAITNIRLLEKIYIDIDYFKDKLVSEAFDNAYPSIYLFSAVYWRFRKYEEEKYLTINDLIDVGENSAALLFDDEAETPWQIKKAEELLDLVVRSFFKDLHNVILKDYFQKGVVGCKEINEYNQKFVTSEKVRLAEQFCFNLYEDHDYNQNKSKEDLREQVKGNLELFKYLSIQYVSHLIYFVENDLLEKDLAKRVFNSWKGSNTKGLSKESYKEYSFDRKLHPLITSSLKEIMPSAEKTLSSVVLDFRYERKWERSNTTILNESTQQDFLCAIKALKPIDLKQFMYFFDELIQKRLSFEEGVEQAVRTYKETVKSIKADSNANLARVFQKVNYKD